MIADQLLLFYLTTITTCFPCQPASCRVMLHSDGPLSAPEVETLASPYTTFCRFLPASGPNRFVQPASILRPSHGSTVLGIWANTGALAQLAQRYGLVGIYE
ncbi:hypothetical protein QBC47DRAFT_76936 [Echria macrotheca]|uniref:Secreted protein n=1 Tax=Echria macrotheca TaxID=438768 RepID=A0AAJ0B6X1_9PEZI|nr:hypothetical protein QBC47DRAFT_76936 [Echria macrotheca]